MNRLLLGVFSVALLLAGAASSALAQATVIKVAGEAQEALAKKADLGPGVRVGAGLNPEQFVIGFRFGIDRKKPPRLVPSIDFGFGDNITTIVLNIDVIYRLRVEGTTRVIYGGAGPALAFMNTHGPESSWNVGLSIVAGMRISPNLKRPLNVEVRFGAGDIPDARVLLVIGL